MTASDMGTTPTSLVVASATTSGTDVNLHPLAILNMSDHYTRSQFTKLPSAKLAGVLLGTQKGREIAVVNSFELLVRADGGGVVVDDEFLAARRDQYSEVFPTLSIVGWYAIGAQPTAQDAAIHAFMTAANEAQGSTIFVLFNPDMQADSKALPFDVYESALNDGDETKEGRFVQLQCGIETGEAERIAVDGVAKESTDEMDKSGQVSSLTMQRNAIAMLHERIQVLLDYVSRAIEGKAPVDHDILRQIASLTASLPVMDAPQFNAELETEYHDAQLTTYLTSLLQQLEVYSDYSDKHLTLHPRESDDMGSHGRAFKGLSMMPNPRRGRRR